MHLPLELSWQKNTQLVNVEPALAPYLLETQSLTAKLKSSCDSFSVSVIANEHRVAPVALQNEFLELAWCREVTLNCNGKVAVYGQSWLNDEACSAGMDSIGETPLGELLFTDVNWQRGELEFIRLRAQEHPLLLELMEPSRQSQSELFARKSWFKNGSAKILVCEVFVADGFYDE
ncbi:chorismate--pyruvate lyase family protein [Pseudoalteromonas piscicida]|uniref:chorismate--pyruvate lyase family protein n=1 Tax=Pseudoalteromonas piscicida TaxID=43662 RepID=UPI003095AA7A